MILTLASFLAVVSLWGLPTSHTTSLFHKLGRERLNRAMTIPFRRAAETSIKSGNGLGFDGERIQNLIEASRNCSNIYLTKRRTKSYEEMTIPKIFQAVERDLMQIASNAGSVNELLKLKASIQSDIFLEFPEDWADGRVWSQAIQSVAEEERSWSTHSFLASALFFRSVAAVGKYEENSFDPFVMLKKSSIMQAIQSIEMLSLSLMPLEELEPREALICALQIVSGACSLTPKAELDLPKASQDSLSDSETEKRGKKKKKKNSFLSELLAHQKYHKLTDIEDIADAFLSIEDSQETTPSSMPIDSEEVRKEGEMKGKGKEVSIILGNIGLELVSALLLGHLLITLNCAESVRFVTKSYPSFIYGATAADVLAHIAILSDPTSSDIWAVRHIGELLAQNVITGRFIIDSDPFWSQPTIIRANTIPHDIFGKIFTARNSITVFIGDINLRRLIGDKALDSHDHQADEVAFGEVSTLLCCISSDPLDDFGKVQLLRS